MNLGIIYGTIVGLLLGLAYCYWQSLTSLYNNRDTLTSTNNLINDASSIYNDLKQKL
jgi:hypothetical protein